VGRSLSLAVLAIGALLGVAAPFLPAGEAVSQTVGPTAGELGSAAGDLEGRLRETAAAVRSRATTLAEIPTTAAIVSTDANTVTDLSDRERAFRVGDDETIELGQVMSGGSTTSIIELPRGSPAGPPLDEPGVHLAFGAGKLWVSEVVFVKPSEPNPEIKTGVVAVTRGLEVKPFEARLAMLSVPARLEFGGKVVATGGAEIAAGSETVTTPFQSDVAQGLALVTQAGTQSTVSGGLPLRMVAGGGALVALLIGVLLLLTTGRKRPPVAETLATAPTIPPLGTAPTELGGGGQAITPVGAMVGPGQVVQPSIIPRPGSTASHGEVGRYTLKRLLGSGGMAEVYLARVSGEAGFERDVALKVMHRALSAQPVVVEHFLDEARLASRLVHPNIVQISDLGRAGDEYFIAMEFIDGSDLERLLTVARLRGALVPVRVGLAVARKIADGLHHAHTATSADGRPLELVHRDVKSANVFVSRKGEVKVGDFGIAKANQASRVNKTQLGQVKGTAAYMAPEHRTGQAVDLRADLYGVGAITYEILTGTEVNLDLAMLAHLGRQGWPHLPKPSEVRPDLPAELDTIVFKALAYEKEERYASCEAFEADLEAIALKYNLVATDKVIAQWVEGELAAAPAVEGSLPPAQAEKPYA
jgi:hypothetical protein